MYKHHYIDIHRDIRVELQGEGAEESTDWLSNEEPDQVNLYSLFFSSPPWESLEFIYCLCENPVVEILWPRRVINEGSQWEVRKAGKERFILTSLYKYRSSDCCESENVVGGGSCILLYLHTCPWVSRLRSYSYSEECIRGISSSKYIRVVNAISEISLLRDFSSWWLCCIRTIFS